MNILEIILIGIALSMDAAAVSMTNGMVYKNTTKSKLFAMPILFGLFQGLMPVIGYFAGGIFSSFITKYSNILILVILGFIGFNMVKCGLSKDEKCDCNSNLTFKLIFFQAIATSIDAFAVGIGFSAMQVNIFSAGLVICTTTAICSLIAIFIGEKFGDLLGKKAEVFGGVILIFIAIKAVL
ncbi:manganese efflux pump MntP family protein [Clostridium sp.]|uniref:manganese efflux pump MntP n=1 Tax=Clostridium sp. TaxID=1506 RepID=UPI003217D096